MTIGLRTVLLPYALVAIAFRKINAVKKYRGRDCDSGSSLVGMKTVTTFEWVLRDTL